MGLLDTTMEMAKLAGKFANPELVQEAQKANAEALAIRAELWLLYAVAAVSEPCGGVVGGDGFEGVANGLFEGLLAASLGGAQKLFELGPGLLDRVQVRRVGWQIDQLRAAGFDPFAYSHNLVRRQVIEDHYIARL